MTGTKKIRDDLVHKDLSYKIVGALYDVYNQLGYGHLESVYQKALAEGLKAAGLKFVEQLYCPVVYKEKRVGLNYFDFLVEDCVVVELKKGDKFAKTHIEQVYKYLVAKNIELGILAYFAPTKVHYKRILNLH